MSNEKKIQFEIARMGIYYFFGFSSLLFALSWLKIPNLLPPYTFGIINVMLLIYFSYKFFKRNLMHVAFIAYIVFMLFLVSMLHQGNYPYILAKLLDAKFLFGSIAALFIFSLCDDSEKILKWSVQVGYFVVIVNTGIYLWQITSHVDGMNYMSYAYSTITSWAMIAYDSLKNKKWYGILFTVISAFFLAMYGSRGGILCMLSFVVFYAVLSAESKAKRTIFTSVFVLSGVTFLAFFDGIVSILIKISQLLGISSRNLFFLENLSQINFLSRTEIWSQLIPVMNANPLIGSGIGSDNYYLGGYDRTIHNGYLELILNFGYLFGGILLILIIGIGIYMFFLCKDKKWRMLFGIFYVISIPKLMLSYSIYLNYELFASLAIFYCYIRSRKLNNSAYN